MQDEILFHWSIHDLIYCTDTFTYQIPSPTSGIALSFNSRFRNMCQLSYPVLCFFHLYILALSCIQRFQQFTFKSLGTGEWSDHGPHVLKYHICPSSSQCKRHLPRVHIGNIRQYQLTYTPGWLLLLYSSKMLEDKR